MSAIDLIVGFIRNKDNAPNGFPVPEAGSTGKIGRVNRRKPTLEFGNPGLGDDDPFGCFDAQTQRQPAAEPDRDLGDGLPRDDELAVGTEESLAGNNVYNVSSGLSSGYFSPSSVQAVTRSSLV